MKNIIILGSTGSVGENAVRVACALSDRIRVIGIVGNSNLKRLAQQAALLGCEFAATGDRGRTEELAALLPSGCKAFGGSDVIRELVRCPGIDMVLCAIVGTAGLPLVLSAIDAGKDIALASKEVLVMAGALVMDAAKQKKIRLIPVDSEHSAVFQCLEGKRDGIRKVILTASGGPFRGMSREELEHVTCAEALHHPTWNMGPKVTLDSATLMNKALEMLEAHHLFAVDAGQLDVLVHPQSIVHSMVEFEDGVIMAQMSRPDMRFPIQYAYTYPERCDGGLARLDLTRLSGLTFEKPDTVSFPSLSFAYEAIRRGGTAGAVLNAANEVAVERFRAGELEFTGIFDVVEKTMEKFNIKGTADMNTILEADLNAREFARQIRKGNRI